MEFHGGQGEKSSEKCNDEITSNTVGNLKSLLTNKLKGGRRTNPKDKSEMKKVRDTKDIPLLKCPQCDFLTQNETFFNEHVSKAHAGGQPTCPFCFIGCKDFPSLRKHCADYHKEVNSGRKISSVPEGRKRPCRFFRNGLGKCMPRSGNCMFDHTIIPDHERELCFHKHACTYKPYCIFFHPEGQEEEEWLTNVC